MRKISQYIFAFLAWFFIVGALVQVFLAGLVVVAFRMSWENHIGLGHALGIPLILMLVTMYLGGMPRRIKRLTWILFGVYIFQADISIFMRVSAPFVAALHPVLALVDFALGLSIARQALDLLRKPSEQVEMAGANSEGRPVPVEGT